MIWKPVSPRTPPPLLQSSNAPPNPPICTHAETEGKVAVQPVFISVDPARDSVRQVKEYVREFHPRLIGLTGPPDRVNAAARAYRVYHMRTNDSSDDYLIDHSIITYLLDPEGRFVTFYGKNYSAEEMARSVLGYIRRWQQEHPEYKGGR